MPVSRIPLLLGSTTIYFNSIKRRRSVTQGLSSSHSKILKNRHEGPNSYYPQHQHHFNNGQFVPRQQRQRRRQLPSQHRYKLPATTIALLCVTCYFPVSTSAIHPPNPSAKVPLQQQGPPPPPPPLPLALSGDAPGGGSARKRGHESTGAELPREPDGVSARSSAAAAAAAAASAGGDGGDSTTDHCSDAGSTEGSRSSYWSEVDYNDDDTYGNMSIEESIPAPDQGQHGTGTAGKRAEYYFEKWGGGGDESAGSTVREGGEWGDGITGRGWRHEDLKQLLQELEDTEISGFRSRGGRNAPVPSSRNPEEGVGSTGNARFRRPLRPFRGPGSKQTTDGRGFRRRKYQRLGGYSDYSDASQRTCGGANRENVSLAGQGLTLAPPPPFPRATKSSSGSTGSSDDDAIRALDSVKGSGWDSTVSPRLRTGTSFPANDPPLSGSTAAHRLRMRGDSDHGNGEEGHGGEQAAVLRPFQERSEEADGEQTDQGYKNYADVSEYEEDAEDADGGDGVTGEGFGRFPSSAHFASSKRHQHQAPTATSSGQRIAMDIVGSDRGTVDALSILQSGEFSDTGSAGTWTDADTEELHQHGWRDFDHLAGYGYSSRYVPLAGPRAPGSAIQHPGVDGRRLVPPFSAPGATRSYSSVLGVDYSAKVYEYGSKVGAEQSKTLTLRSWARLAGSASIATVGAFLAVSPNNAPRDEYLALFRRNLGLLATSLVGPAVYSFLLYDWRKANVNTYVRVVTFAFTWGYLITLALEIILATAFQLIALALVEPGAFMLCPEVPAIFLPWVLRDHDYTPSPLYSCVADLLSFCVGAPIVECAMMVWIVRRLGALPKRVASVPTALQSSTNTKKSARSNGKRKGAVDGTVLGDSSAKSGGVVVTSSTSTTSGSSPADEAAAVAAASAVESAQEPTHVHTYLLYVLGSAMGLKAACTMQRVLVYTRDFHEHKAFFALARGFFPLYELCGSIIAMNLARREILGDRVNKAQLFLVAVSLNSYAIFRGTKPVFKWAASKPWDELQVKAWVFPSGMTPFQLVRKAFASVAWSLIILKVTAHVIKTYWRLNRLHSSRLRAQHEAAAIAAAAAEQRAAFALHAATEGRS